MKKITVILCVILFGLGIYQTSAQQLATVGIEITQKLKKGTQKAETESAVVSKDVMKDGKTVIAAGTPVTLDIHAEKRHGLGVPGTIKVVPISTTDVNGQVVLLNGEEGKYVIGKNRRGAAVACGIVFGIITFPVGLLFLCIKGGHASIPAGTQMVATATLN